MNKKLIFIILIIFITVLVSVFIVFRYYPRNKVICGEIDECKFDHDCITGTVGDGFGIALYPPCYKCKCHYPETVSEWIEFCNLRNGIGYWRAAIEEKCYRHAAYEAIEIKKVSGKYKATWDAAFAICKKYYPREFRECKISVCDNIDTGTILIDGEEVVYEIEKCFKEANK